MWILTEGEPWLYQKWIYSVLLWKLILQLSFSLFLFICFFGGAGFSVCQQNGSPITSSVHWQVGQHKPADDVNSVFYGWHVWPAVVNFCLCFCYGSQVEWLFSSTACWTKYTLLSGFGVLCLTLMKTAIHPAHFCFLWCEKTLHTLLSLLLTLTY